MLSSRHLGVMLWLLEHPAASLTECARALGYSRSWLSRIVNAPEFRAVHRELLGDAARQAAANRYRKMGLL